MAEITNQKELRIANEFVNDEVRELLKLYAKIDNLTRESTIKKYEDIIIKHRTRKEYWENRINEYRAKYPERLI